jgi:predicted ATPase
MNNFRGFSETMVPLKQINFLVGENSTGKSSFLALLSLVNQATFWFLTTFALHDDLEESSYSDLVSAWAKDKSSFQVGIIITKREKSGKTQLSFSIHMFSEKDDSPQLVRHSRLEDGKLTTIIFESTKTKYRISDFNSTFESEADAISQFKISAINLREDVNGFKTFPKDVPPNSPLPMVVSILKSLESGDGISDSELKIEIPIGMKVTWIAPIRTKPRRIYDGIKRSYSPGGEHAPLLLRRSLSSRTASKHLARRLAEFGESSGLFETVIPHSFGRGTKNPFELLIRFKGADLNINNVGYGVSQVLPLIVEFLTTERRRLFTVQQPEVHLHPKAQAALGGLIFELSKEKKHAFFIETHSDYLIDRYRLAMRSDSTPPESQMLFFVRTEGGNNVHCLKISNEGLYPADQPKEFRDFFIKEEIKLLDI